MTFQSNIPRATDLISVSQGDLLNNFSSLQTIYNNDHFGFNPETNTGFHKHITLPDQTLSVPAPGVSIGAEYATTVNAQTYPQWKRDGLSTVFPMMPIKAYAYFTAANPPVSNFTLPYANVNAITRGVSAGNVFYNVQFVSAFPNTTYGAIGSVFGPTNLFISFQVIDASNIRIFLMNSSGVVNTDPGNSIMVAFIF